MEIQNKKLDEGVFMQERQEVLCQWPTGKDVDLQEAVHIEVHLRHVADRRVIFDHQYPWIHFACLFPPVAGGLGFNQAVWLLDTLVRSGRRIVGFDVVEVTPAREERIDAITGARVLWKLCNLTLKSNVR